MACGGARLTASPELVSSMAADTPEAYAPDTASFRVTLSLSRIPVADESAS